MVRALATAFQPAPLRGRRRVGGLAFVTERVFQSAPPRWVSPSASPVELLAVQTSSAHSDGRAPSAGRRANGV
jgi:hypothetical protein